MLEEDRIFNFIINLIIFVLLLTTLSCSSEKPAGLHIYGSVKINDNYNSYHTIHVNYNGRPVEDARVILNGDSLVYTTTEIEGLSYYTSENDFPLTSGDMVTLEVYSTYGDTVMSAIVPGEFSISAPVAGSTFPSDQPVSLNWRQADQATNYGIRVLHTETDTTGGSICITFSLNYEDIFTNVTATTLPGSIFDQGEHLIMIWALNGRGDYFSMVDEITLDRMTGFWVERHQEPITVFVE